MNKPLGTGFPGMYRIIFLRIARRETSKRIVSSTTRSFPGVTLSHHLSAVRSLIIEQWASTISKEARTFCMRSFERKQVSSFFWDKFICSAIALESGAFTQLTHKMMPIIAQNSLTATGSRWQGRGLLKMRFD